MAWEIEYTDQFEEWWETLSLRQQRSVESAVEEIVRDGPALGRPVADTIHGSRFPNMKELRPQGGNLRVLFAFDPRRIAILLIGGDKTGRWQEWYEAMIPRADELYETHLVELRREGLIP